MISYYFVGNTTYTYSVDGGASDITTSSTEHPWNGLTVKDVFGDLAEDLRLGFAGSWANMIFAVSFMVLVLGCVWHRQPRSVNYAK